MVSFRGLSCKNLYKSKQGAYMAQQIAISSTSHTLCVMLAQVPGAEWQNQLKKKKIATESGRNCKITQLRAHSSEKPSPSWISSNKPGRSGRRWKTTTQQSQKNSPTQSRQSNAAAKPRLPQRCSRALQGYQWVINITCLELMHFCTLQEGICAGTFCWAAQELVASSQLLSIVAAIPDVALRWKAAPSNSCSLLFSKAPEVWACRSSKGCSGAAPLCSPWAQPFSCSHCKYHHHLSPKDTNTWCCVNTEVLPWTENVCVALCG